MADVDAAPRPDVTDMYAVHGVFRDTLGAAPVLVGGVASDNPARVALVANYYENVLSFLEAHHDGEEKLVFPLLRDRCNGTGALIDEMDKQHQEALDLLGTGGDALAAWPGGGAAANRQRRRDWSRSARIWSSTSRTRRPMRSRWPRQISRPRNGGRSRATAWPPSRATRSG